MSNTDTENEVSKSLSNDAIRMQFEAQAEFNGTPFDAQAALKQTLTASDTLRRDSAAVTATIERELEQARDYERRGAPEQALLLRQGAEARREALLVGIEKAHREAREFADHAEAVLTASLIPATAEDSTTRLMYRQELDAATKDKSVGDLVATMLNLTGQDDALDAELFSPYAQRKFGAATDDPNLAKSLAEAFRTQAIAKLGRQAKTAEGQAAARALLGIGRLKGSLDAVRTSAQIRARR